MDTRQKKNFMTAREKRVLYFLNELYDLTKNDYTHIVLTNLTAKHNIGNSIIVTVKEKLIYSETYNGYNSKKCYKWKSIKPNIHMVKRLIKESREYEIQRDLIAKNLKSEKIQIKKNKSKVIRSKTPKKPTVINTVEKIIEKTQPTKTKSINILWGLIKIVY